MDFIIDRADLLAATNKCQIATDAKHSTEVFRLMLVESKKKAVRFAASGERGSVATVAAADIKSQGNFIVPPPRMIDIASSMPPGRIHVSLKGDRVTVKSMVSNRKATFQSHTAELQPVPDPGKGAAWKEVNAIELTRALQAVKHASHWEGQDIPTVSLLIPTDRGLDVFGCNTYIVTLIETSIRMDGDPIQVPDTAAAVLALMTDMDENVSIFCDGNRTYFENADTLVSTLLAADTGPQAYRFKGDALDRILGLLRSGESVTGPSFSRQLFQDGLKSVLRISGFAGDSERAGAYGFQVRASFGEKIVIELGLSASDARDEFECISPGSDLAFWLSSKYLDQMLSSISFVDEVQVLRSDILMLFRSQGVICGIVEKDKR